VDLAVAAVAVDLAEGALVALELLDRVTLAVLD
jgi:hypothetical protein